MSSEHLQHAATARVYNRKWDNTITFPRPANPVSKQRSMGLITCHFFSVSLESSIFQCSTTRMIRKHVHSIKVLTYDVCDWALGCTLPPYSPVRGPGCPLPGCGDPHVYISSLIIRHNSSPPMAGKLSMNNHCCAVFILKTYPIKSTMMVQSFWLIFINRGESIDIIELLNSYEISLLELVCSVEHTVHH